MKAVSLKILFIVAWSVAACGDEDVKERDQPRRVEEAAPELDPVAGYGYHERACGFDLDDDGVVGEEQDCRICDGRTVDPDGDGVAEDLFYIDADHGTDDRQCGAPGSPCKTIGYVWTQRADGGDDSAEDILCFRGTSREDTIRPASGGVPGTVELPARGAQERSWQKAKDPMMLVGWDFDGDGQYPPFDKNDVAVLDGVSQTRARAFQIDAKNDFLEIAHLVVKGFGELTAARNSGFVQFGPGQGELKNVSFHDLHLVDINQRRAIGSDISTFNFFSGKTVLHWIEVSNVWAPRNGGFFVRGSAADQGPDAGPFRFEKISSSGFGCDFALCSNGAAISGFHLWGYLQGVEVIDNFFDANVKVWEPKPKGGPSGATFATPAQCSRDWTIRNNLIVDFKNAVKIQGWAENYCDNGKARAVERVLIERNIVRNSYEPWSAGDSVFYVSEGGEDKGEVVGELSIINNVVSSAAGFESCFWLRGGSGDSANRDVGPILFANNTCAGDANRHAAITLGNVEGRDAAFPHGRVTIANNIVTGLNQHHPNVRLTYLPSALDLRANRYDPAGVFIWQRRDIADLAAWQKELGSDRGSESCLPSFVDFEKGNLRLQAEDSCALDGGVDLSDLFQVDAEGKKRGKPWDVGAFEIP